jgi:hypothetical protein
MAIPAPPFASVIESALHPGFSAPATQRLLPPTWRPIQSTIIAPNKRLKSEARIGVVLVLQGHSGAPALAFVVVHHERTHVVDYLVKRLSGRSV